MKNKILAALLCTTMGLGMIGCGSEATEEVQETVETEETVEVETETETETETEEAPEGMAMNPLTGEWIDEDLASQRPFALMVPNDSAAYPHYGVSQADIIYEASCRGDHGFTRCMYIWQDYSGMSRIGNTRSARTYYAIWSKEYDALFAHYGQSPFANPTLNTMDDMDALGIDVGDNSSPALDSIMFFRSSDKSAPHNAYTSSDGIQAAIEKYDYRTELSEGYESHFNFASSGEEVELEDGIAATTVEPGYTTLSARFEYNEDDGLYYRYTWGSADTDGLTGDQLAVKNIFIQIVDYSYYTTDDPQFAGLASNASYWNGQQYLNIDTMGGGTGYYITNGKAIEVTWTKDAEDEATKFFDENGDEITVNQGKTWFCIVLDDRTEYIEFNGEAVLAEDSED